MPLGSWSYFEIARATVTSGGLRSFQINRFALATSVQQPPSMSGKSRGLGLAVLAMIVAFDLAGCDFKNAYVPPPPSKVVVAQPVQKPVTLYLNLTGNTAPFASVNLVARVQGYLESIDYKDGAAVTKGTQLFGIERDIYQAQLDQAKGQLAHDQAVLEDAQMNLTRYQTLEQQKSIAAQQAEDQVYVVQQDKGTVLLDQANVETATINLGYTRVLAPFDGVVTNHQVDLGALVGMSGPTTLATIVRPTRSTSISPRASRKFWRSDEALPSAARACARQTYPTSRSRSGCRMRRAILTRDTWTTSRRSSTPRPAR